METESHVAKQLENLKINEPPKECRILWLEDNPLLQKMTPKDFLSVIEKNSSIISTLLNLNPAYNNVETEAKNNCINVEAIKNGLEINTLEFMSHSFSLFNDKKPLYVFHLDLAVDGPKALQMFYNNHNKYNFLLFDEEIIPGPMKGSNAITIIRNDYKEHLIISWSTTDIKATAEKAGADKFFLKDIKNLKPVIIEILKYALSKMKPENPEAKGSSLEMKR